MNLFFGVQRLQNIFEGNEAFALFLPMKAQFTMVLF